MLDRIWASWRNSYVRTIDDDDPNAFNTDDGLTLFEAILASSEHDDDLGIVHRGELTTALLNRYPYGSGHMLVIPNRGVPRLADLTSDEHRALWDLVDHTVGVLEAEYECAGVNVGLNQGKAAGAGIPAHLHVHVVPRWLGDTNFMTPIAETRVLAESLDVSGERIRSRWALHPGRS